MENLVLFGFHTTMSASDPGAINPFWWSALFSETKDWHVLKASQLSKLFPCLNGSDLRPDVEDPCSGAWGDRHKPLCNIIVTNISFFVQCIAQELLLFNIFFEPGVIIPEWTPLCQITAIRSSNPFTPFGICISSRWSFLFIFSFGLEIGHGHLCEVIKTKSLLARSEGAVVRPSALMQIKMILQH